MAQQEALILGGLDLNNAASDFLLLNLDLTPPAKRPEWITGSDADGAALVRDPLVENRTIKMTLRIAPQASMDVALAKIGTLVDKLEEAEKQPDGLALTWTPSTGTKTITFYVLTGQIDGMPISRLRESGWFRYRPTINVTLICKPFGYGAEVTGSTATSSSPVVTVTQAGVPGDVPAEGRLLVTDMATQARRHCEWGLENRYYDATQSLLINSASFTLTGYSGASAADVTAYNSDKVTGTSYPQATALAAVTGAHIGTYRVKARCQVSNFAVQAIRLNWKVGDGPYRANSWSSFPLNYDWVEVDLGLITIQPVVKGTQQWTGRIEVISNSVDGGDAVWVDYVVLIPAAEGYGKARGTYGYSPGTLVAKDAFTGKTNGAALNALNPDVGTGPWATSGAPTDFTIANPDAGGGVSVTRATTGDTGTGRYALLPTLYTNVEVSSSIYLKKTTSLASATLAVLGRYVDSNNYLEARIDARSTFPGWTFYVAERIAGTTTTLQSVAVGLTSGTWYAIRLLAFTSGRVIATLYDSAGGTLAQFATTSVNCATGGALASGKAGLRDFNGSFAGTRNYDSFSVSIPPTEPIVINSTRAIEFRSDDPVRADSAGTYWGAPPSYRGSRFLLPPAGDQSRTSRILVKARRADVDTDVDNQIADSTKVEVFYTPRYLVVPR